MAINLFDIEKNLSPEIIELCQLYARINRGMMREKMYTFLASAIISSPIKPTDFLVEIGTFHGLTATFMARLLQLTNKNNKILSIDPFGRLDNASVIGKYPKYMENTSRYEVEKQCFALTAFSHQAYSFLKDEIPFIMVDGSHKYADVRIDLETYLPKLKRGGFAYLHDNSEKRYPGVFKAINDTVRNNPKYKILVDDFYVILQKLV